MVNHARLLGWMTLTHVTPPSLETGSTAVLRLNLRVDMHGVRYYTEGLGITGAYDKRTTIMRKVFSGAFRC